MQDFFTNFTNFINSLGTKAQQVESNANKAVNQAVQSAGNQVGNAANQAWTTITSPFRYIGNQWGNAANQAVQGTGQVINDINQNIATPVAQKMQEAGTAVNNAVGLGNQTANTQNANWPVSPTLESLIRLFGEPMSYDAAKGIANSTKATANTGTKQTSTTKTYYTDPGIDSFVNIIRFAMNPLHGITGDTPTDVLVDYAKSSLYNTFGKEVPEEELKKAETTKTSNNTTETKTETETTTPTSETTTDTVTYTYKPGDTFGQVIKDLGLETSNGLWGAGGDVEYYTRQLVNQGALDRNGNIPIGTTIRLTRRK